MDYDGFPQVNTSADDVDVHLRLGKINPSLRCRALELTRRLK
jgi:hypothetical protein